MRIFAVSDLHVDYEINAHWVAGLSRSDYRDDVLILAGDISDKLALLGRCLEQMAVRFKNVLFVPGNHELWVARESQTRTSLEKFADVCTVAQLSGVSMKPYHGAGISIVPLLGWYDYSFGQPGPWLRSAWADYRACRWPAGFEAADITAYFTSRNDLEVTTQERVITFSHFLPRIDLMPAGVSEGTKKLFPVLGTAQLDPQLRRFKPLIHVYGHSHLNRKLTLDGVCYINNAFAYPQETRIAAKRLLCILE